MPWFPSNPEADRLAGIFFDLRRELFRLTAYYRAPRKGWETKEEEKRREKRNKEALMRWDLETRRMILDGEQP